MHILDISPEFRFVLHFRVAGDVVNTLGLLSLAMAISQETDASSCIFKLPSERPCVPAPCGSGPQCGLLGWGLGGTAYKLDPNIIDI